MPEARLTTEEVRHLAVLARVGMTDDEIETMRDQMSNILENFDILSQVDTESVEPTGHSVEVTSVMRDDLVAWYTVTVKLDLEARGLIKRLPGSGPQRLVRSG